MIENSIDRRINEICLDILKNGSHSEFNSLHNLSSVTEYLKNNPTSKNLLWICPDISYYNFKSYCGLGFIHINFCCDYCGKKQNKTIQLKTNVSNKIIECQTCSFGLGYITKYERNLYKIKIPENTLVLEILEGCEFKCTVEENSPEYLEEMRNTYLDVIKNVLKGRESKRFLKAFESILEENERLKTEIEMYKRREKMKQDFIEETLRSFEFDEEIIEVDTGNSESLSFLL